MMNLIIGLCVGLASAIALVVMWRLAEHLRKEMQSRGNQSVEPEKPHRDKSLQRGDRG